MHLLDLRRLVRVDAPRLTRAERDLARIHCVEDAAVLAARRLPRPVAHYLEGGADRERSLDANLAAFARHRFLPRVLVPVGDVDLSVTVAGRSWSAPLGLAPTGMNAFFHPDAEVGVARAALEAGVPAGISTVASTSYADVVAATAAPAGSLWFQLYVFRERARAAALIDEALGAGADVLEVAVDAPVGANRLRDARAGLTSAWRWRALLDAALRPSYWTGLLRGPSLGRAGTSGPPPFDPTLSWDDLADLRRRWPGRLLLKGLLGPNDVRRAVDAGVDGIHLSNHGGRQLDQAAVPLDLLPSIRDALGERTLVVDSGIRTGSDIAVALALGADAAFVGRPYLWGLAVAGQAGVARVIDLLTAELERTLRFLGLDSVRALRDAGPSILTTAPTDLLDLLDAKGSLR